MNNKVYKQIAISFNAYNNCINNNNKEYQDKHEDRINQIIKNCLPSGSGIDSGIDFLFDQSKDNYLVFDSAYHVMNDNGCYTHWIHFKIIIKPSLQFGFDMIIKGNFGKCQDIKDYLYDTLDYSFNEILENTILLNILKK